MRGNRASEAYLHRYADFRGVSAEPTFVALPLADQVEWLNQQISDEHGRTIPPENRPTSRALLGETVTGSEAVERVQSRDGRDLLLSVSAAPVRNGEGRIVGAVVVGRDVTLRRALSGRWPNRSVSIARW